MVILAVEYMTGISDNKQLCYDGKMGKQNLKNKQKCFSMISPRKEKNQ